MNSVATENLSCRQSMPKLYMACVSMHCVIISGYHYYLLRSHPLNLYIWWLTFVEPLSSLKNGKNHKKNTCYPSNIFLQEWFNSCC